MHQDDKQTRDADEAKARQRTSLEILIADRLRASMAARKASGIETIWQEDEDQYNGIDEANPVNSTATDKSFSHRGSPARQAVGRSRIHLNITKPKTDTAVGRVQEMMLPTDERPWELSATPVPEIENAAAGNDDRQIQLADGNTAPAQDVAKAVKDRADKCAAKMGDYIEDWFVEGRVYAEQRRVFRDAGRIGSGVLKGPYPTIRQQKKWIQGPDGLMVIEVTDKLCPTSKCISAWDLFPDPSCGERLHDGAFVIERDYLTARTLREIAKQPDYDTEAIAEVLAQGPQAVSQWDTRGERDKPGQVKASESETFETFYYYGDIPPEQLIGGDWDIGGLIDSEDDAGRAEQIKQALMLATIPVVATMVNGRVVKIGMNPLETGEFPFDVFAWEPVDGQIWGRSSPRKMAPAARMLNAATRAMFENAGMSAGPQIVIGSGIEPIDKSYDIVGRKLWRFTATDDVKDVRQAFQVAAIPSAQQELQAIIDFALSMADQLSNLPLLMQGGIGSAPDTVGGMAMLQNNAASPLKAIAKQYDDNVVVPHLSRYYAWAMQDPAVPQDCKGDHQVKARGATALIQRDFVSQFLPSLMPFVKDPAFKIDPEKYLAELLRSNKLTPDSIKLTDTQIQEADKLAQEQPPPQAPQVEAAHIRAEAVQAQIASDTDAAAQRLAFDAQQNQMDRELERYVKEIEFQIQTMEFAGKKEISLEQVRAIMATKAMDVRNKRELFSAERNFAEGAGNGRGL